MSWTDERIETLKALWAAGYSAAKIAEQLRGCTRNAVIGKLHRLNLTTSYAPTRSTIVANSSAPKRKRPAKAPRDEGTQRRVSELRAYRQSQAAIEPAEQSEHAVSFYDVTTGQCRYPIGDATNLDTFRYCGAPQIEGRSYCLRHAAICYTDPAIRRNAREKRAADARNRAALEAALPTQRSAA
jgi:GcrA cell cycle regulator